MRRKATVEVVVLESSMNFVGVDLISFYGVIDHHRGIVSKLYRSETLRVATISKTNM
jgi:hypothetical protein